MTSLILVEQHRPPVDQPVIELPGGIVGDLTGSADESPEPAARRELEEETGYRAGTLQFFADAPTSPGLSDEVVGIWVARGLERVGPGGGDASESITTHVVPLAEVDAWLAAVRARALVDLKVYAGVHIARHPEGR